MMFHHGKVLTLAFALLLLLLVTPASGAQRGRGPVRAAAPPPDAAARCRNGTYCFSQHRRGTCSHHGGVAAWLGLKQSAHESLKQAGNEGAGCDLPFAGSARKDVKLRPPGLDYPFLNGGRAISVAEWFAFVCPLDVGIPTRRGDIPAHEPMKVERRRIKLRAFVLAVKLDPDNDLHVQIGDRARPYRQQQIIVEIPPGDPYCDARAKLTALFRADGGRSLARYQFRHPPLVELTGYLFFDSAHMLARRTDYCTLNGGRGIKGGLKASPVRGIWELHPVLTLEVVGHR